MLPKSSSCLPNCQITQLSPSFTRKPGTEQPENISTQTGLWDGNAELQEEKLFWVLNMFMQLKPRIIPGTLWQKFNYAFKNSRQNGLGGPELSRREGLV